MCNGFKKKVEVVKVVRGLSKKERDAMVMAQRQYQGNGAGWCPQGSVQVVARAKKHRGRLVGKKLANVMC